MHERTNNSTAFTGSRGSWHSTLTRAGQVDPDPSKPTREQIHHQIVRRHSMLALPRQVTCVYNTPWPRTRPERPTRPPPSLISLPTDLLLVSSAACSISIALSPCTVPPFRHPHGPSIMHACIGRWGEPGSVVALPTRCSVLEIDGCPLATPRPPCQDHLLSART